MSNPSDGALVPAQATQDTAWLRNQLAPAREPLARLTAALPSVEPIADERDAVDLAASITASEGWLADIEACVAPTRSRIHAMRTELSRRVKLATKEPIERIAQAKRVLGAWRARERVRSRPRPRTRAWPRRGPKRSPRPPRRSGRRRSRPAPRARAGSGSMEIRNEPALRASVIRLVAALGPRRTAK